MSTGDNADELANIYRDTDHSDDWWMGSDPLLGSITLLITVTAVLGNLTAIYYISTSAALRTPSFLVLLLLAIVDLSTGVLHLPFVTIASYTGYWMGEPPILPDRNISLTRCECTFMVTASGGWCKVSSYIRPFTQPVSFVTVVIISALRALSMYFPIAYRRIATTRVVVGVTLFGWVLTVLFTLPSAWYVSGYNYNLVAKQCFWNFTDMRHIKFGFVYNTVVFFILVSILIVLITLIVVGLSRRQTIRMGEGIKKRTTVKRSERARTDYKHASLISIFIGVIFMISIFPFYILGLIRSYTNITKSLGKPTEMMLRTLTFWMLYLSPVLNPLLYVLRLPKVRTELNERSKRSIQSFKEQSNKITLLASIKSPGRSRSASPTTRTEDTSCKTLDPTFVTRDDV